ncbi:transporter substrate-binding domain-containing protein [Alloscardovia venturai]|uniref:Transporter substrate-binding domain-containing protein n=1 Tax=Alloscardovia venturai TaxID=1769421 RepID=A0ABW2Y9Q1_9BIFI
MVRKVIRRGIVAFLSAVILISVAACGLELSDVIGPTVKIGIAFDRPGLSTYRNGAMRGFSGTVARAVAFDLGYSSRQIEWVDVNDSTQDDLFATGKIDMLVGASMYSQKYTNGRSTEFAGPFMKSHMGLMTRGGTEDDKGSDVRELQNSTQLTQVQDKSVCVVKGELQDDFTPQQLVTFESTAKQMFVQDSYSQCLSALATATVDVIVGNVVALEQLTHAATGQKFSVTEIKDSTISYGIVVPAGDDRLHAKIQNQLRDFALSKRWEKAFRPIARKSSLPYVRAMKAPYVEQIILDPAQ